MNAHNFDGTQNTFQNPALDDSVERATAEHGTDVTIEVMVLHDFPENWEFLSDVLIQAQSDDATERVYSTDDLVQEFDCSDRLIRDMAQAFREVGIKESFLGDGKTGYTKLAKTLMVYFQNRGTYTKPEWLSQLQMNIEASPLSRVLFPVKTAQDFGTHKASDLDIASQYQNQSALAVQSAAAEIEAFKAEMLELRQAETVNLEAMTQAAFDRAYQQTINVGMAEMRGEIAAKKQLQKLRAELNLELDSDSDSQSGN